MNDACYIYPLKSLANLSLWQILLCGLAAEGFWGTFLVLWIISLQVLGANTHHKVIASDVRVFHCFLAVPLNSWHQWLITSNKKKLHFLSLFVHCIGLEPSIVVWNQARLIAEIPNHHDFCFKMLWKVSHNQTPLRQEKSVHLDEVPAYGMWPS